MGENSAIAWTDYTWNPWIGCTKVSAACDYCYAADYANRYEPLVTWGEPGTKSVHRRTAHSNWRKPIQWDRKAFKAGRRIKVFCASMADIFDSDVDPLWRADFWGIVAATPSLDWQLLTKRPQNIHKMLPSVWDAIKCHVWLGTTAENQTEYDRRKPYLLSIPAKYRFFSIEPMLGPIDLGPSTDSHADWYICGGESGTIRRPFDLTWAENLRRQVSSRGAAFFFKQDAALRPGQRGRASDALWACKRFPDKARMAEQEAG